MSSTSRTWAVITGAGSGIGRALALRLSSRGHHIIAIGRREAKLQQTRELSPSPERIHALPGDVSDPSVWTSVLDKLPAEDNLAALVHNAAIVGPLTPFRSLTRKDFQYSMAVNVEAPMFMTQALLPRLEAASGRVLHISSGLAHSGKDCTATYCTTKAALFMVYKVLKDALKDTPVRVGSVRPGVVDSEMQAVLRATPEEQLAQAKFYRDLHENSKLMTPEHVAKFLDFLLFSTADEEFEQDEWDVRDAHHQERWNN